MSEEIRAIRPDEMDECLDLWAIVFECDGRGYFVPYFNGDPAFRPDYTRVCAVDRKLVSVVQICERKVHIGSSEILMGGIGNVATLKEYRGKGYSSKLLQDAVKVMYDCGLDHSVLFTGIQPFYEKVGWRTVPIKNLSGQLKKDISDAETDGYSIRTCDWKSDMASVQSIHEAFNRSRSMTSPRLPDFWTGYILPRFSNSEFAVVAESKGVIVGYLIANLDEKELSLKEIGYIPEHKKCAEMLIRHAAGLACGKKVEILQSNLPEEPEILAAIGKVTEQTEPKIADFMMCQVINMPLLSERILPELNKRARESGLVSGSVSLDTEQGNLTLTISDGKVSLGAANPTKVEVSVCNFFNLLLGLKGIEELDLSVPEEVGRIISELFPPQRVALWPGDGF